MRKTISALSIVLLLALLAITMASSVAADPTPQTITAATAPAFQHVQVANYGQSLAVYMDISGTVRYTPTIYAVMKNNAGR